MQEHLFRQPISNFVQEKIDEARHRTEALTDAQLQDPALAGTLEKICDFRFEAATLRPADRMGKRRTTKVSKSDYGQQIIVDVDVIDVTIPFTGWPKSFHLAPSGRKIINTPASIVSGGLLVSFPDDQNLDHNVDDFVAQVAQNLESLKRDIEKIKPQMLQAAQLVANQRLAQIKARKERDKTRSFPIE